MKIKKAALMVNKRKGKFFRIGVWLMIAGMFSCNTAHKKKTRLKKRPNILFIVSDDQGYPHASAYGCTFVNTPTFDHIAKEGLLFTHFFVCAPQCSPSRASILTGQFIWQNGPAGTHWSTFPAGLITFPDVLKKQGYVVGYTGKGWGPGNWLDGGRTTNPAGTRYLDTEDEKSYEKTRYTKDISGENYAGSFKLFLSKRDKSKPFCFWLGGHEPHRPYEKGSGLKRGKKLSSVVLPPYLPDVNLIKSDMLDYAVEIEWFDKQAGKALKILEDRDLLKNTLVVFTSDNGMPFPRAKAFCFDAGNHVPLAIMWPGHIRNPGRTVDDLVSAVDLFPTFLQAAGIQDTFSHEQGKSLFDIFKSGRSGITDRSRRYIFWGRERHSDARWNNLGYPERAVRSLRYLYIRNLKPERYPAGAPKEIRGDSLVWAYDDIDPSPSKTYMIMHQGNGPAEHDPGQLSTDDRETGPGKANVFSYFKQTFDKFPKEMLYDIKEDPYCLNNLAKDARYKVIKDKLSAVLEDKLKQTHDPRLGETPNIWESYRRYGPMRRFPRPAWADSIIKKQLVR